MPTDNPKEFPFPWPNEDKGYALFPADLEEDPLVLFHGTAKTNLEPILKEGFKATKTLSSVSYAKNSTYSLTHVIGARHQWEGRDAVIFAVRFASLGVQGIANNTQDIHVNKPELQPEIIGYCIVPGNYEHR
jgi:hypothetical protein